MLACLLPGTCMNIEERADSKGGKRRGTAMCHFVALFRFLFLIERCWLSFFLFTFTLIFVCICFCADVPSSFPFTFYAALRLSSLFFLSYSSFCAVVPSSFPFGFGSTDIDVFVYGLSPAAATRKLIALFATIAGNIAGAHGDVLVGCVCVVWLLCAWWMIRRRPACLLEGFA